MKIVLMTSIHERHMSFVNEILKYHKVECIFLESKKPFKQSKLLKERNFFKNVDSKTFSKVKTYKFNKGDINSDEFKNHLIKQNPDVVLVFGTSIIKSNVLNSINGKWINIHTGLVQKFRGVSSCFWAIFENSPESIGFTLHKVNKGIDTGSVLLQGRPRLEKEDDIDIIFFKTCLAAQ